MLTGVIVLLWPLVALWVLGGGLKYVWLAVNGRIDEWESEE